MAAVVVVVVTRVRPNYNWRRKAAGCLTRVARCKLAVADSSALNVQRSRAARPRAVCVCVCVCDAIVYFWTV